MQYRLSSYDLSDGYIPASLIKEWFWCPTFAWLAVMSVPEPLPPHITTAERPELTRDFMKLVTYYRGQAYVRPTLKSKSLKLKGSPDLLIITEKDAVVIEWKTTSPWASEDHVKAQATVYALLAAEATKKKVTAITATTIGYEEIEWVAMAPKVLEAIQKLRASIKAEEPPEPGHDMRRCRNCPYRKVCPWVVG